MKTALHQFLWNVATTDHELIEKLTHRQQEYDDLIRRLKGCHETLVTKHAQFSSHCGEDGHHHMDGMTEQLHRLKTLFRQQIENHQQQINLLEDLKNIGINGLYSQFLRSFEHLSIEEQTAYLAYNSTVNQLYSLSEENSLVSDALGKAITKYHHSAEELSKILKEEIEKRHELERERSSQISNFPSQYSDLSL